MTAGAGVFTSLSPVIITRTSSFIVHHSSFEQIGFVSQWGTA